MPVESRSRVNLCTVEGPMDGGPICLLLASFFVILAFYLSGYRSTVHLSSDITVLVGVVSSRDHFVQRDAVRRTWATLGSGGLAPVRFLVGKLQCPIPPQDRNTPEGCSMHLPELYQLPQGTNEKTLFNTAAVENVSTGEGEAAVGFSIKVMRGSPVVRRLGVVNGALSIKGGRVRAYLADSRGGRVLATASFIHDPSLPDSEFLWKAVSSPVVLETGFEGEVVGVNLTRGTNFSPSSHEVVTPAVAVLEDLRPDGTWVPRVLTSHYRPLTALSYTLSDVDNVRGFLDGRHLRLDNWVKESQATEAQLKDEISTHGDIVLLDVVDVYSNICRKIHQFFNWASSKTRDWHYLLKTDDDVFVDLKRVVGALTEGTQSQPQQWNVWSCFKEGVRVPSGSGRRVLQDVPQVVADCHGSLFQAWWATWHESPPMVDTRCCKWRDWLPGGVYPAFPSGGGYVLSRKAVHLLAGTRTHLDRGEDVRLGLLLPPLSRPRSPDLPQYCQWTCSTEDKTPIGNPPPCNVQELSTQQMFQVEIFGTLSDNIHKRESAENCGQRVVHERV
ncbi:hypothetical protein AAG570_003813 [Ranatra chinensis]|uniref:UDP-GalNAc:beta-1,3-N-acetylgalactosaminyltransferase 2 n=1 Tax=Ranatra chinensis TaxID=642074 RepID=A0ABD0Y5W4_9HEMI